MQHCRSQFFCVNPIHTERLRARNPRHAGKIDTLITWANPQIFQPTPFRDTDGPLRVVYAGRMDLFKRPEKMFAATGRLAKSCETPVEFHYVGDGEVDAFPNFEAIRSITIRHGRKPAAEVAAIVAQAHVGILTSDVEGMPRFVIETIALGRPVCALHLPQLETLVRDGRSGHLIARHEAGEIDALAACIAQTQRDIRQGSVAPEAVAKAAEAHRPETILGKIYDVLRGLSPPQG